MEVRERKREGREKKRRWREMIMVWRGRPREVRWTRYIQVEAAANPKESSSWLPAPASTVSLASSRTRIKSETRCIRGSHIYSVPNMSMYM